MVFGAMRGGEFIVKPLNMASNSHDLDLCLKTMVDGFQNIIDRLDSTPVSFVQKYKSVDLFPHIFEVLYNN